MSLKNFQAVYLLIVCVLVNGIITFAASAASRGISVNIKASESRDAAVVGTVELYSESYALVIGNDDYTNGWPKLSNAIKDAELIAQVLEEKGFEVELHKNLDSDGLNQVFKRFFILKGDNPAARLFIWYAGHGATVDGEGYLIPTDAPVPTEGAAFKFASVALRDFGTYMRQAVSKHAYAVFDSCFAGTVFSSQRAIPPAAITRATTQPVRQFLTSGDADQTVSDDGTFRELFIRAINGEERSDSNGDGYITASELGMFLGDRVTNLTESAQTPRYGKLRDKNFDRGDFVFSLGEGAATLMQSGQNTQASAEITFWNSVKNSSSSNEFDAYLSQYPEGAFAALAMLKKSAIEKQAKAEKARTEPREKFRITFLDADMEALKVANIRETPLPSAPRVGRLDPGDRVWVIGQTQTRGGTWYKVARDGIDLGFVYAPLLASAVRTDGNLMITASALPAEVAPEQEPARDENQGGLALDDRLSFLVEDLLQDSDTDDATGRTGFDPGPGSLDSFTVAVSTPGPGGNRSEQEVALLATSTTMAAVRGDAELAYSGAAVSDSLSTGDERADVPSTKTMNEEVPGTEGSANPESPGILLTQVAERSDDNTLIKQLDTDTISILDKVGFGGQVETNTVAGVQNETDSEPVEPEQPLVVLSEYITRYIQSAQSGNPKAQLSLGYMYETGEQVGLDKQAAVRWYRAAADQGELQAMVSLGLIYERGGGIEVDLTESARWFRKAAQLGDPDAQQSLGYMYEQGNGVVADPTEAAKWYMRAAEQGRVTAQNNLGRLFQLGIGVEKNLDKAIFWYDKAAAQGSEAARKNLSELIPERY